MSMYLRFRRSRVAIALATAVTASVIGAAGAVAATTTPPGGSFRVFGVSNALGPGGSVLVTGAVGDHGRSQTVNKAGKPSPGGTYVKLTLSQGTVMLNQLKLGMAINKAFGKAVPNTATCSLSVVATATIPIVSGTGLYANASGSANITIALGFIQPRYTSGAKSGQCNFSNNVAPISFRQIVTGTGNITF
jgi:hypothetical protein